MTQSQTATQSATAADPAGPVIDIGRLRSATVMTDPYEYVVISDFITPAWRERMIAGYPTVPKGGSWPLATVTQSADFKRLIDELNGADFRHVVEEKFDIDLSGRPTMFTVRGVCRAKDGKIHTDSVSKMVTVLLYMNPAWAADGGRLRLLRSSTDLENVVAEIPPTLGTLLVFKCRDNAFHGHLPFEGERRVIQMNWVTEQKFVDREKRRHMLSSLTKRLGLSH